MSKADSITKNSPYWLPDILQVIKGSIIKCINVKHTHIPVTEAKVLELDHFFPLQSSIF